MSEYPPGTARQKRLTRPPDLDLFTPTPEPMTAFSNLRPQRWLLLALLLLPLTASSQNRADRGERLQRALDLTDAQVALVTDAVGDEAERGDLWAVAVALTPTLTDGQREKLFDRPERPMRNARGPRGERRERVPRRDADERAERHEEQLDAMSEALDLTDAQVQQLNALHAERQAEVEARREAMQQRRAERPGPGELPAELEAILTPEQQEIARVHRALAAHMTHRGMQRRGPRR